MIETSDLYKGAYLMCCGGHLQEMRKTKNHRVSFVIQGNLMKEDILYQTGRALVNPLDLRKFILKIFGIAWVLVAQEEQLLIG